LRTVGAVFGAATGLDAEKRAALNGVGIVVAPMNGLGLEQELGEWKVIERFDVLGRPVVSNVTHAVLMMIVQTTSS
jgi:hypothetical protein